MANTRKKQRKKQNAVVAQYLRPTPQREAHNDFRTAGMAMRVVPVIDRLHEAGVLSENEHRALSYYRDQASLADRSPVRSCLDDTVRGGGYGPGVTIMSASIEAERIERGMGPLRHLCRSIAVYDMRPEDWAMAEWGAAKGSNPPRPDPLHVSYTMLELKYAAGGIVVNG